jgi:hypothetical protein
MSVRRLALTCLLCAASACDDPEPEPDVPDAFTLGDVVGGGYAASFRSSAAPADLGPPPDEITIVRLHCE